MYLIGHFFSKRLAAKLDNHLKKSRKPLALTAGAASLGPPAGS
jgi:hypothetical protein